MQLFRLILAGLLVLAAAPLEAAKPVRIVSLALCTDQLLLMLAERRQIASLSTWVRDRNLSYMADAAGEIPLNNASVEEVLRFEPDLVVTSQFAARDTVQFLRRLGYDVRELPQAKSIAQVYETLERFGGWIGQPQAARAAIRQMRARLRQVESENAGRPRKRLIVYAPNGYTIGAGTLENDLFASAGYRNLAAEMGITGFEPIALENLVAADPDVLLIERNLSRPDSLATAYVGHPLLDKLAREREELDIPTATRICAGPMIVDAVELMARRR